MQYFDVTNLGNLSVNSIKLKLKEKGIAKELIEMYFEHNTYEDKDKIIKLLELNLKNIVIS